MANKYLRRFVHGQGGMPARSLPLHASPYIPLPLLAPLNCSADRGQGGNSTLYHEKEAAAKQQLVRSHSCSRLQGKQQQLAAAFKSLLHRPGSHDGCHSQTCPKLHSFAAANCSTQKSCSSSKLVKGKRAPKGHVVVYVEAGRERHVVPICYLGQPHFQELLERAEREYGYAQQGPGLRLPCSFSELHHTLHQIINNGVSRHSSGPL